LSARWLECVCIVLVWGAYCVVLFLRSINATWVWWEATWGFSMAGFVCLEEAGLR
jgi:hypothetical protein